MPAPARAGRVINLTFHGIGKPAAGADGGEADVWLTAGQFESALDAVAERDDVRITFDDGNASDLELALPALERRGLRATFFVVTDRLGQAGYLDAEAVRTLVSSSMHIGCHGMRHRSWRGLSDAELREEVVSAREQLQEAAGHEITAAACPFGAYDRRVLGALRRYGYERVFTSDGGAVAGDRWLQPRTSLRHDDWLATIQASLAQAPPSPRARLTRQAKLTVKRWR